MILRPVVIIACASLFSLVVGAPAAAQSITDNRAWAGLTLQGRPSKASPWRWSSDYFLRTRDGIGTVDVVAFRVLAGYDLTSRSSLWGGYLIGPSFPASGGTTIEHRVFQQFLWSGHASGGTLSFRTRLEQRFIEDNSGVVWRIRELARYSRPLSPTSAYSIVGWDEILFHANETTKYDRGLDQNRVFAGLGRAVGSNTRIEVGYLNQYSHSRSGPNRLNHVLSVTATIAF